MVAKRKKLRPSSRRLNLGSGDRILRGWVNLDKVGLDGVDVVHDMDALPLPFPDNHFEEILCEHVLCYASDFFALMEDLWRISADGATIMIIQPYPGNKTWFTDPIRKNPINENTFPKFFGKQRYSYYSKVKFEQISERITRNRRNPFVKENIILKLRVDKI